MRRKKENERKKGKKIKEKSKARIHFQQRPKNSKNPCTQGLVCEINALTIIAKSQFVWHRMTVLPNPQKIELTSLTN